MATTGNTPLEESWFLERERAVAWLRLAFAVLAIAVIQLNPERVARFPLMSALVLGSFLIYSAIALVLVVQRNSVFSRFGSVSFTKPTATRRLTPAARACVARCRGNERLPAMMPRVSCILC